MPRKTDPITQEKLKNAKPKDTEYTLHDGNGLLLRIKPTGSKNWFFSYYHPVTKKRVKLSFGPYPEVDLAEARAKTIEARNQVKAGIDPLTVQNKKREEELLRKQSSDFILQQSLQSLKNTTKGYKPNPDIETLLKILLEKDKAGELSKKLLSTLIYLATEI